jgi:hydroxymethylglutaryl-CoA reductase
VKGSAPVPETLAARGYGAGKVILLGEHAVVYGRPALAAGLAEGVEALLQPVQGVGRIRCASWGLDQPLDAQGALPAAVRAVLEASGVAPAGWDLEIRPGLPPSAGLGSSAALCVAVARAARARDAHALADEQAAAAAFAGERCFHGSPSGIDNTVAAFGGVLLFQRPALHRRLGLPRPLTLVVAHSGQPGGTAAQVACVREGREREPRRYEALFDEIGALVHTAVPLLESGRVEELGSLLDRAHACLQQLGVSSGPLDEIVAAAREAGALGAKLTGAGGGGCAIALCAAGPERVAEALERRGYAAFVRRIPGA